MEFRNVRLFIFPLRLPQLAGLEADERAASLAASQVKEMGQNDLPVPGSPMIRTDERVAARVPASSMICLRLGSAVTKSISRASSTG